jgi:integrase
MASIYKEGSGWCVRVRLNGKSGFQSGFARRSDAMNWARETELTFLNAHPAKGLGPYASTLAIGLRDYAFDFVGAQKGARHAVARINAYLRNDGLPLLKAIAPTKNEETGHTSKNFQIEEVAPDEGRLPRTFEEYRAKRLAQRPKTTAMRERLASMYVAKIAPHHILDLKKAMEDDGMATSSVNNELSLLSAFFNKACKVWQWTPLPNPCDNIERKTPDNQRDRTLSDDEEKALGKSLAQCNNPYVAPLIWFAIETAMRKGEMLLTATWDDVNWEKRILHLTDAKCGRRDVPLTKAAVSILEALPNRAKGGKIFPLTADALDSAWERACARAGIKGLHIHDLRHTATTRHSKRLNGNIFLLQLITGHKSLSMLARYVNLSVEDVLDALDSTEAKPPPTPKTEPVEADEVAALPANVIAVAFGVRRVA